MPYIPKQTISDYLVNVHLALFDFSDFFVFIIKV